MSVDVSSGPGGTDCQCCYGAIVQRGPAPPLPISPWIVRREKIFAGNLRRRECQTTGLLRRGSDVSGNWLAGGLMSPGPISPGIEK